MARTEIQFSCLLTDSSGTWDKGKTWERGSLSHPGKHKCGHWDVPHSRWRNAKGGAMPRTGGVSTSHPYPRDDNIPHMYSKMPGMLARQADTRRLGAVERETIRHLEIIPRRCRWAQIDVGDCKGIYYTTASSTFLETHASLRTFWGWTLGRYCESGSYLTRVLIWGLSDNLGRECLYTAGAVPFQAKERGRVLQEGERSDCPSVNTCSWCGIPRSAGPI